MADDQAKNILAEGMKWVAGSGVGVALGVFVKGILTGTTGQEKEIREALAERLATVEAKVDALEKRLDAVTKNRDQWRWKALEARTIANEYARKTGETPPVWTDPEEVAP